MTSSESGILLNLAMRCAVCIRFLISLPLRANSRPRRSGRFESDRLEGRKFFQISVRARDSRLEKGIRKWIRESNAGSISSTRLVVRNMSPPKYSMLRKKTVTSAFRSISVGFLLVRNSSASSRSKMAFHLSTRLKTLRRLRSADSTVIPSSLELMVYRGLCVSSAALSNSRVSSFRLQESSSAHSYPLSGFYQILEDLQVV